MKREHVQKLLEDFPDLVGSSTLISNDLPDMAAVDPRLADQPPSYPIRAPSRYRRMRYLSARHRDACEDVSSPSAA